MRDGEFLGGISRPSVMARADESGEFASSAQAGQIGTLIDVGVCGHAVCWGRRSGCRCPRRNNASWTRSSCISTTTIRRAAAVSTMLVRGAAGSSAVSRCCAGRWFCWGVWWPHRRGWVPGSGSRSLRSGCSSGPLGCSPSRAGCSGCAAHPSHLTLIGEPGGRDIDRGAEGRNARLLPRAPGVDLPDPVVRHLGWTRG